jgi:hypothetical protein
MMQIMRSNNEEWRHYSRIIAASLMLCGHKKSGWVIRHMHAARGYYSANPSSARVLLFSPTCFLIS